MIPAVASLPQITQAALSVGGALAARLPLHLYLQQQRSQSIPLQLTAWVITLATGLALGATLGMSALALFVGAAVHCICLVRSLTPQLSLEFPKDLPYGFRRFDQTQPRPFEVQLMRDPYQNLEMLTLCAKIPDLTKPLFLKWSEATQAFYSFSFDENRFRDRPLSHSLQEGLVKLNFSENDLIQEKYPPSKLRSLDFQKATLNENPWGMLVYFEAGDNQLLTLSIDQNRLRQTSGKGNYVFDITIENKGSQKSPYLNQERYLLNLDYDFDLDTGIYTFGTTSPQLAELIQERGENVIISDGSLICYDTCLNLLGDPKRAHLYHQHNGQLHQLDVIVEHQEEERGGVQRVLVGDAFGNWHRCSSRRERLDIPVAIDESLETLQQLLDNPLLQQAREVSMIGIEDTMLEVDALPEEVPPNIMILEEGYPSVYIQSPKKRNYWVPVQWNPQQDPRALYSKYSGILFSIEQKDGQIHVHPTRALLEELVRLDREEPYMMR
jgi:hypothetical protein